MKQNSYPNRFLTLALFLALAPAARAHSPAQEMAEAATNFLAALTPEQRSKAVFDFNHDERFEDRKSTRLNSSHRCISYAVFCLKKKNKNTYNRSTN